MRITLLVVLGLAVHGLCAQIHIGPGQPHPNIQSAAAVAQPGDTIYVHAGTYAAYQYYDGLQGSSNAWITIKRFGSDAHVIRGGWQFSTLRYVRFEDLDFRADANFPSTLMNLDNNGDCALQCAHIVIDGCTFRDVSNSNSLKFGGVDSAEVMNCTFESNTSTGAGLALNVCHNVHVHDNHFEDIHGKAVQTKLGTRYVLLERNFIRNCGTDDAALKIGEGGTLSFHCPGDNWLARDIKVHANIIIGGRASFSIGQAQDCEFVNNTCINPVQFVTRVLADDPTFPCSGIVVRNNIFHLTQTIYFNGTQASGSNIQYDTHLYENNLFYRSTNPSWQGPDPLGGVYDAEEILGTVFQNNSAGDPQFVDLAGSDFHLLASSPAIGAAAAVTEPMLDYYASPYGSPRSIGAVEYTGSTAIEEDRADLLTVFPIPASEKLVVLLPSSGIFRLDLYDAAGRAVANAQLAGPMVELELRYLNAGIYVLDVSSGAMHYRRRVVKQ